MGSVENRKLYKILSLDGGGIFCLPQAMILQELFRSKDPHGSIRIKSGHEILAEFDMVIGCSGGAIVASALAADKSPKQIADLFLERENRAALFNRLPWYKSIISYLLKERIGSRFSTDNKKAFLQSVLNDEPEGTNWGKIKVENINKEIERSLKHKGLINGDKKASKEIKFLYVTYDYDRDRCRLIRSDTKSKSANRPESRGGRSLAEAAHASSTAPIRFFDKPAEFTIGNDEGSTIDPRTKRRYWDGAMTGYNNPVLLAITEAIASGIKREDIRVLSLGARAMYRPEYNSEFNAVSDKLIRKRSSDGFFTKLKKATSSIVADPPDTSLFISHVMLSPEHGESKNNNIVRMAPLIQPLLEIEGDKFSWVFPGSSDKKYREEMFKCLIEMDIASHSKKDINFIKKMTEEYFEDSWNNQHIKASGFYSLRGKLDTGDISFIKDNKGIYPEIGHFKFSDAKKALSEWCSIWSG
mgnify:CR=1 FL=1